MNDEIDTIKNMEIKRIKLEQNRNEITSMLQTIKKKHAQDVSIESNNTSFHESQNKINQDKILKERFASDKQVIDLKNKLENNLLQTKLIKIDIKYANKKLHYHNIEKSNETNTIIKFISKISRSIEQIATNTKQN